MSNLHFLHPYWLWLLLAIPLIWGIRLVRHDKPAVWERIVDKQLMPFVLSGQESAVGIVPLIVLSLSLLLAVLAMAGPSWAKREVPVFRNQQPLVVALDLSASMLAEDEKPNRLTLARFKLFDLLKTRKDGQTGLVVFSGDAFVVSPLTDDLATIEEQVKHLSPDIMPASGSLVTPAIQRAEELLKQAGNTQGHILIITDGAADADTAAQAAAEAHQQGYTVSVLAIGTAEGAPIPRRQGGFMLDSFGQTVLAKVDSQSLATIAKNGGGLMLQAALGDEDLQKLTAQWQNPLTGQLSSGQGRQVDTWINQGYWLILLLLPLAAWSFRRGWLSVVLLCCLIPPPQPAYAFAWADLWQTPDQQAQTALTQGQAQTAQQLFQDPQWKSAAAYKSGDYAAAAAHYGAQADSESQYNYGNSLAKQGKLKEALAAYENVLKTQPNHADARYNLDMVKKALEQQQQNKQQNNNLSNSKANKQNQDQQDQQNQQQNQAGMQGQNPQQDRQDAAQQAKQEQQDQQATAQEKQAEQEKQQQAQNKPTPDKQEQQQSPEQDAQAAVDPQQREQQQATEQWLQRIPDDPAGLWRRKFQYQYQQRGSQARGQEW